MSHVKRRGKNCQATYRGPDHHERSKTFPRRRDADDWVAAQTAAMRQSDWVDPQASRVLLATYAAEWLSKRIDLRPTTRSKYTYILDRHVLPALGSTQLGRLNSAQIREWLLHLREQGPATAASAYRLLSTICHAAVSDRMIASSPCNIKGAGAEHASERPVISVAELEAAVPAAPERFRLAILIAAWCQLRRGEVLGLQRADINQLHRSLTVRRTWSLQHDGIGVLGPPKTEAGRRTLAIPQNVMGAIEDHLDRYVGVSADAWLFPGQNQNPVSPRSIDRAWVLARKSIERDEVRFHDLRHSGLSWVATTGATLADLMKRAGHASPAAAIRYQHATQDREIADALARLASPKESPSVDTLVPSRSTLRGHNPSRTFRGLGPEFRPSKRSAGRLTGA
jgi:integrase